MKIKDTSVAVLASAGLLLVLFGCLFSFTGCAEASGKLDATKAEVAVAQGASALESREKRLSYALGMVLGNQFRSQSVEVDTNLYAQGLEDALSGGMTLLTEAEARAAVNALQKELSRKPIAPPGAVTALTAIEISFKLDSRLTRSMYMGDRWVSPPTFTQVGEGQGVTVEAIAQGLDASGKQIKTNPEWILEDPEMMTVTPDQGNKVKITVKRAGQTKLKVVAQGVSKELGIKATSLGETIQVEISQ